MHLTFRNVNDAFTGLVSSIHREVITTTRESSRVGEVIKVEEPVIVTYERPLERVLFNDARDANPFFHLFESLWMLAGRRDIKPLEYFSSKYPDFVRDGDNPNANGAYGYRWRNGVVDTSKDWTTIDQLDLIVRHLIQYPNSRRAVLSMWNVDDDLKKIDDLYGEYSKDVCCNTQAYFSIRRSWEMGDLPPDTSKVVSYLDMTVTNRSNDLTLGMLGANVVHFSFLQEYMAAKIGVGVGVYNQFTNNLHAYTSRWEPEKWLASAKEGYTGYVSSWNHVPLVKDGLQFDRQVRSFIDDKETGVYTEPFLRFVAEPMCLAFSHHKNRDYDHAMSALTFVRDDAWRIASEGWIMKRRENYEKSSQV